MFFNSSFGLTSSSWLLAPATGGFRNKEPTMRKTFPCHNVIMNRKILHVPVISMYLINASVIGYSVRYHYQCYSSVDTIGRKLQTDARVLESTYSSAGNKFFISLLLLSQRGSTWPIVCRRVLCKNPPLLSGISIRFVLFFVALTICKGLMICLLVLVSLAKSVMLNQISNGSVLFFICLLLFCFVFRVIWTLHSQSALDTFTNGSQRIQLVDRSTFFKALSQDPAKW